jgi:hypothetical protein
VELFDTRFQPAANELLLVGGYPGFATPAMGEHHLGGPRDTVGDHLPAEFTPVLTFEVTDPARRPSDFVEELNVMLNYERPAFRGPGGIMREPPDAGGMSGSLVWDTKIRAGGNAAYWSPESARVCGLVWGWCNERQVLIATKIEHVRTVMLNMLRREEAFLHWISRGRPMWEELVDWDWAEAAIPQLQS